MSSWVYSSAFDLVFRGDQGPAHLTFPKPIFVVVPLLKHS